MSVKQISIFVENKPGRMNGMTEVLAENNINMRALALAETEGFGIVRIIVDDVYEATTVLKDAGYINKVNSVVVVEMPDVPGGLNKVLKVFTDANINLEYMYAIAGERNINNAYLVFRVDDHKAAEHALKEAGIRYLAQEDLAKL
ncbi:MAG: ACT domain-containing protein [Eubacterium sp.]|nr:ACT domain-containing protein [Eubacterium sp.]